MTRIIVTSLILAAGTTALAQDTQPPTNDAGQTAAPPADQIITRIETVSFPAYDASRRAEEGYIDQFMADRRAAMQQKADLILELYHADLKNEALIQYLPERWSILTSGLGQPEAVADETAEVMKSNAGTQLATEAAYARAASLGALHTFDTDHFMPAFEAYAKLDPGAERGARLLMNAAISAEGDQSLAYFRRIVESYPDTKTAGYAKGKVRQHEQLGKPFELTFTDAVSGQTIQMKDLRGKVVVIDFWATWCGPCVAELPHMKELYAQYHDKGVEFLGVSLDVPEDHPAGSGLEKLKAFVAERQLPWPQYYQGNYWDSDFSTSWGINSIPALFVVDQKGNLYSTDARGKLETILPDLLGEQGG